MFRLSEKKLINQSKILQNSIILFDQNDIAGPYSGILFGNSLLYLKDSFLTKIKNFEFIEGLSNTIGTLPGIIGPYVAGLITKNVKKKFEKNTKKNIAI